MITGLKPSAKYLKHRAIVEKKHPFVIVSWLDACSGHAKWTSLLDLDDKDPGYMVESTGWLVRRSRHGAMLMMNMHLTADLEIAPDFSNSMWIPEGMLLNIKLLRGKMPPRVKGSLSGKKTTAKVGRKRIARRRRR